jgi:hypothetical protein
MIRSLLALERLFFLEQEGKVGYRHGENSAANGMNKKGISCGNLNPISEC